VRLRSDIQIVSDNEFVRDFDDFRKFRKDRFLESTAFGFRHFGSDGSGAIVGGVGYADDRQNPDFDDRDRFLLQRAPSVTVDWLPTPVPQGQGLTFELGVDYTHFRPYERAEDALDLAPGDIVGDDLWADIGIAASTRIVDIIKNSSASQLQIDQALLALGVGDGRFEEGEPLNDQGHRVILYPHLARSFRLFDSLDVLPEVGWQQSLYTTRAQSFADRGLLMARLDVSSQLVGTLAPLGLPETTHVLEPRFGWALVQHQSQTNNPLFIPETAVPETRLRQLSLDNVVLDDADRIRSANVVTLGFGNRFYRTRGSHQRLLADVSLSGAYNFAARAGHFQQLILEGTTFGASGLVSRAILGYDLDRGRIAEGLAEATLPLDRWLPWVKRASITAGYRYRREIPRFFEAFPQVDAFDKFERGFERINQITVAGRVRLSQRWTIGARQVYSFENQIHQTNRWFFEYVSPCRCWGIHVDLDDNRNRGFQANATFSVMGFGESGERPFAGKSRFGSGLAY
jgi:lipopolysaccharide assembly outer membrane protein LptD (OstA)